MVLLSGSAAYVGIGSAADAVHWLAAQHLQVLGLEGFTSDGVSVRPLPEFVADFAEVVGVHEAAEVAIAILREWVSAVDWVDIIVSD